MLKKITSSLSKKSSHHIPVGIERIMRHARAVMSDLGRGHRESVYHKALCTELAEAGIPYRTEVCTPIMFKGQCVGTGRADLVVKGLVIEIKTNAKCPSTASAQLQKYIESMREVEKNKCRGVVINFNSKTGRVESSASTATSPRAQAMRSRFFSRAKKGQQRRR